MKSLYEFLETKALVENPDIKIFSYCDSEAQAKKVLKECIKSDNSWNYRIRKESENKYIVEGYDKDYYIDTPLEEEIDILETYTDEELSDMIGKIYNVQKIESIYRRTKYGAPRLFAKTVCINCGRQKTVFLSNLVNDPDKYGSCVCSDTHIDATIEYAKELYDGTRKLSSNTSGYTGVSFVKTYKGQPYNKWRAYIEVDGERTYLGDFNYKKDAIKARKDAGEKGIKWYKQNRNRLMKDMRKKTKKYATSKYKDRVTKTFTVKKKKKK